MLADGGSRFAGEVDALRGLRHVKRQHSALTSLTSTSRHLSGRAPACDFLRGCFSARFVAGLPPRTVGRFAFPRGAILKRPNVSHVNLVQTGGLFPLARRCRRVNLFIPARKVQATMRLQATPAQQRIQWTPITSTASLRLGHHFVFLRLAALPPFPMGT